MALRSAQAGSDLLLITGSEADSRTVFASLRSAAKSGTLPMSQLMASYNRIIALKSHL